MTPRSPAPPTATGLPRSEGSSSTSTEAKEAARSTGGIGAWSTDGFLEGEFDTAKSFAVGHADGATGLSGTFEDDVANGLGVADHLRRVGQDGLHLDVDGPRNIRHHVGLVGSTQQQHAH